MENIINKSFINMIFRVILQHCAWFIKKEYIVFVITQTKQHRFILYCQNRRVMEMFYAKPLYIGRISKWRSRSLIWMRILIDTFCIINQKG